MNYIGAYPIECAQLKDPLDVHKDNVCRRFWQYVIAKTAVNCDYYIVLNSHDDDDDDDGEKVGRRFSSMVVQRSQQQCVLYDFYRRRSVSCGTVE